MEKIIAKVISITLLVGLAACAGREARPVAFSQAGDQNLSCRQLHSEVELNSEQIRRLIGENKKRIAQNVVASVGAVVFLPTLLFIDAKGAESEELEALVNRNKHLSNIAQKKGCPIAAAKAAKK